MIDYRELLKKYMAFVADFEGCTIYPHHYPTTAGDHPLLTVQEQLELNVIVKEVTDETNALYYGRPAVDVFPNGEGDEAPPEPTWAELALRLFPQSRNMTPEERAEFDAANRRETP